MYDITVAVHQNLGYGLAEFSGSRCLRRLLSGCSHLSSPHQEICLPWWLRGWRIHPQCRRHEFDPWLGKTPWRGKGNMLQYSCLKIPWTDEPGGLQSRQESDTTEQLGTPQQSYASAHAVLLADSVPWAAGRRPQFQASCYSWDYPQFPAPWVGP